MGTESTQRIGINAIMARFKELDDKVAMLTAENIALKAEQNILGRRKLRRAAGLVVAIWLVVVTGWLCKLTLLGDRRDLTMWTQVGQLQLKRWSDNDDINQLWKREQQADQFLASELDKHDTRIVRVEHRIDEYGLPK